MPIPGFLEENCTCCILPKVSILPGKTVKPDNMLNRNNNVRSIQIHDKFYLEKNNIPDYKIRCGRRKPITNDIGKTSVRQLFNHDEGQKSEKGTRRRKISAEHIIRDG